MSHKELQSVYYIGFSPINGICNEDFFKGSITVYPNYEIGNIFYSCELVDMNTVNFIDDYKKFVYTSAKSIQKADPNAVFICFNDNKRTNNFENAQKSLLFREILPLISKQIPYSQNILPACKVIGL